MFVSRPPNLGIVSDGKKPPLHMPGLVGDCFAMS
jgi:hypothetical protein